MRQHCWAPRERGQAAGDCSSLHAPRQGPFYQCAPVYALNNVRTHHVCLTASAATYDELDGGAAAEQLGFPALRQQLLRAASGDVLETAVGTGLNLPFYDSTALNSLTGIDLSSGMLAQAARRAEQLGLADSVALRLVQADVERLQEALEERTFDTGGCAGRVGARGSKEACNNSLMGACQAQQAGGASKGGERGRMGKQAREQAGRQAPGRTGPHMCGVCGLPLRPAYLRNSYLTSSPTPSFPPPPPHLSSC